MPERESVEALKNMISEVETLIETTARLPENRSARCLELLRAARALADDIRPHRPPTNHNHTGPQTI